MDTSLHTIVFKTYHAQRNAIRSSMHAYGLSTGQPKILRYIIQHQNCMLKSIAESCDVKPATVSRLLADLKAMGMVTRSTPQADKRALSLCITEKGRQALDLWNLHCKDVEEDSLRGFTMEERRKLEEYLARMYHNLTGRTFE